MDKDLYDKVVTRLMGVNEVVSKLDPAIRSEAFSILRPYVVAQAPQNGNGSSISTSTLSPIAGESEFFLKHQNEKPSENALAVAAFHYAEFGLAPIPPKAVQAIADRVGITVPARIDKTFEGACKDGKALFQKSGAGRFSPTVHGEAYFKAQYGVRKGTKTPAEVTNSDQAKKETLTLGG
jgi:hypothetical protein